MTDITPPLTKGDKTRATIIKAAHDLFLQQGFHGTSMRQIADEAGIALGGIYNYFGTKEEVFGEVLDTYHPYHRLLPALEKTRGETVEEFVQSLGLQMHAEFDGLEEELLPLALVDLMEFRGRYIKRIAIKIIPAVLLFFQKFKSRQGKLRKFATPVVVRTLVSITMGYFLTEMILRDIPLVKSQMPKDTFDQMMQIYLHGILQE